MVANLVNLFSKVLTPATQITQKPAVTTGTNSSSGNPFANPFLSKSTELYGKNAPVRGGYFAGYYNGKPNVVGQRLFVEV